MDDLSKARIPWFREVLLFAAALNLLITLRWWTRLPSEDGLVAISLFADLLLPVLAIASFGRNEARSTGDRWLVGLLIATWLIPVATVAMHAQDGLWLLSPLGVGLAEAALLIGAWRSEPATEAVADRNDRWRTALAVVLNGGLVMVILVPMLTGPREGGARSSRARSDTANIGKAIARVRTDTGNSAAGCLTDLTVNLPSPASPRTCGADLPDCTTATPGYICWGGPYIPAVTNDPWNRPYTVTLDPVTFAVTVTSLGKDGVTSEDDVTFIQ